MEATFPSVIDHGDKLFAASTQHIELRCLISNTKSLTYCILYDLVGWTALTTRRQPWDLFIYKALLDKLPEYLSALRADLVLTC